MVSMVMENPSNPEVIYDKNGAFERVFKNATARVLDFLLLNPDFDYSIPELNKSTQIPIRTLQRVLPHLAEQGFVKERRKVGNTIMYILKVDSPLVQAFQQYVSVAIDMNFQMAQRNIA